MKTSYLETILKQLPEKVVFPYFRDRYALLLLADFVGNEGKTIAELKKSPLRGWLNKPQVKALSAAHPLLTREDLVREAAWQPGTEFFKLIFGEWGREKNWNPGWLQMSRRGKHLVVQLNFSSGHNHAYKKIWPDSDFPGVDSGHPVHQKGEFTLAWARVDLEP